MLVICDKNYDYDGYTDLEDIESLMDITVDGMKSDKLNHAMDQIERAIDSNQNFSLKS